MAGYYGRPVVWINRCSPAAQVRPRGPRTVEVTADGAAHDAERITVEAVRRAFEQAARAE